MLKSLKEIRAGHGMSLTSAAEKLGITADVLIAYEENPGNIPISAAKKIFKLYGIKAQDINIKKELSVDYGVTSFDGIAVVSSRKIAEIFEKRHDNVLQDIRNLDCSDSFRLLNYQESHYKNEQGKRQPEYLMTKDGFVFLVMGYRGKKAAQFKETYIKRFNDMETFIKSRNIARLEYPELTNAVKSMHAIPRDYHYSNEADMINKIVTSKRSKQIKREYNIGKNDSIRDYLELWQVEAIEKLQRFDVGLVIAVPDFQQRKKILQTYFDSLSLQITGSELRKLLK